VEEQRKSKKEGIFLENIVEFKLVFDLNSVQRRMEGRFHARKERFHIGRWTDCAS